MQIMSGIENQNGEFVCTVCGESRDGETALEALQRVAGERTKKKCTVNPTYDRLGPHNNPTSFLPALFVGQRGFFINTKWNAEKQEWELA